MNVVMFGGHQKRRVTSNTTRAKKMSRTHAYQNRVGTWKFQDRKLDVHYTCSLRNMFTVIGPSLLRMGGCRLTPGDIQGGGGTK